MSTPEPVLPTAMALAKRGIKVFPVHAMVPRADGTLRCSCGAAECNAGKHPAVTRGRDDASAAPGLLREWFGGDGMTARNIGVATGPESGIWVLDLDIDKSGDDDLNGETTLNRLCADHGGDWPTTWTVITGSGGYHLWFKWPDEATGLEVRNSAKDVGAGIDVRGRGGYVIAPPSRHANGRFYEWSVDGHPTDVDLAPAPGWLLDMVAVPAAPDGAAAAATGGGGGSRAARVTAEEWAARLATPVREGSRNRALAKLSGKMLAHGLDAPIVEVCAMLFGRHYCEPPLSDPEVAQTLQSMRRTDERNRTRDAFRGVPDQRPMAGGGRRRRLPDPRPLGR